MTISPTPSTAAGLAEIARADDPNTIVESLQQIQQTLLASYTHLAERAEKVEVELVATNAELARKVAELDATRAHLEAILHALPTGVVVRDERDRIVRTNESACSILGTTSDALVGQTTHEGLRGRSARGESQQYLRGDGEARTIASRWSAIPAGGSVEILDDRTEIEHLQERLHAQSKMAALGNMAGGIAHEIRNPMNAVRGFAELLRRELPAEARAQRFATRICEGVDEADQIIASMLTFANPERLALELVDANELCEAAITAAKRVLPENAPGKEWRVVSSTSVPPFRADRIKVRQALRNLIANALQAQPDGGAVSVSIDLDGEYVRFCVQDAGPGIPPALRARVAEPFFTTRAEGTGLGLALVHSIAELHGGRLEVSPCSAPMGGADIAFRIPFQTK